MPTGEPMVGGSLLHGLNGPGGPGDREGVDAEMEAGLESRWGQQGTSLSPALKLGRNLTNLGLTHPPQFAWQWNKPICLNLQQISYICLSFLFF